MKKLSKKTLVTFFIRWWSAGAVYFFIGWGTQLGNKSSSSSVDFIFFLGLGLGLFFSFIVNPVIKMLYQVEWMQSYGEFGFLKKILFRLGAVVLANIIVLLVHMFYWFIHAVAIRLFHLPGETVILPGEPILFGLIYTLFYQCFIFLFLWTKKGITAQ
ncbi:MAG: hypothetical protein MJB14_21920 [Spirochaetes bacterium]|nr:hypothetical protein [Spirochaetota bacterium]